MAVADEVVGLAKVRNRRLFIDGRREFDARVAQLDERWQLEVIVRRLRATRSIQSNRWYWGVIIQAISEHTGYTPDELHDVLKMKFIPKKLAICDGNGELRDEFVVGGSTRKMNTTQFAEYCEEIRRWAASELGIDIPDPDAHATAASSERHGHGWGV